MSNRDKKPKTVREIFFEKCKEHKIMPVLFQAGAMEAIEEAAEEYKNQFPPQEVTQVFPDTEADGYVFCGKCGQMKKS